MNMHNLKDLKKLKKRNENLVKDVKDIIQVALDNGNYEDQEINDKFIDKYLLDELNNGLINTDKEFLDWKIYKLKYLTVMSLELKNH